MSIVAKEAGAIEKALAQSGNFASVTSGTSMYPLFKTHRDMVVLKKAEEPLKKYDVALYKIGNKYILHRVIKVDNKRGIYIIRGDNTYKKEKIPKGEIIATLVSFNRKGKSYSVTDSSYKIYSRVWNFIYPIRYVFHISFRIVRKIFRLISSKVKKVT